MQGSSAVNGFSPAPICSARSRPTGGKDFSKNVVHKDSLLEGGRHLALSRATDTCDSKDLGSEFYGLAANAGRRLAATTGATESKAGIHKSPGKVIVG